MRIYDISLPVSPDLANWPGDLPYRHEWTARMADGASVNISSISCSLHTGTHVDAPLHFLPNGVSVDALDLGTFIGAATVIDVSGEPVLRADTLRNLRFHPRLLLRTLAWTDRSRFPATIPVMQPDVPQYLAERGVILIGVDVPSMDALDSRELSNHHALAEAGIAILESLYLDEAPPGDYQLVALPLKLNSADASPVRAVLLG